MNKDLIRPLTKKDRGMVDKYIRASQYFQSSGKRISRPQWTQDGVDARGEQSGMLAEQRRGRSLVLLVAK